MKNRKMDTFENSSGNNWEDIMKPIIKKLEKYPTKNVEKVSLTVDLVRVYVVEEVNENE